MWPSQGAAFCRLTTGSPSAGNACSSDGRGLAWERQCISYTVVPPEGGSLPLEGVRAAIDRGFAAWIDVRCDGAALPVALGQTQSLGECMSAQYNRVGPNANSIMFLDVWEGEDFPREAFGLTLVWHDPATGEILDADMQINETLAPIALCGSTCQGDVVDLQNLVTHEAGHFLGLGHSNVVGSTMSANAPLGEVEKRSLEADDRAGICSIYGRNPAPTCDESDYAPNGGFSTQCVFAVPRDCAVHMPGDARARSGGGLEALACLLAGWALLRARRRVD